MAISDIFTFDSYTADDLFVTYQQVKLVNTINRWPEGSIFDSCIFDVSNLRFSFMDDDVCVLTVDLAMP